MRQCTNCKCFYEPKKHSTFCTRTCWNEWRNSGDGRKVAKLKKELAQMEQERMMYEAGYTDYL